MIKLDSSLEEIDAGSTVSKTITYHSVCFFTKDGSEVRGEAEGPLRVQVSAQKDLQGFWRNWSCWKEQKKLVLYTMEGTYK